MTSNRCACLHAFVYMWTRMEWGKKSELTAHHWRVTCWITVYQITPNSHNWYSQSPHCIPINSTVILPTLADRTLPYEPIFCFSLDHKMEREIWVSVFIQLTVCMYWSHPMKPYTGSRPGTDRSSGPAQLKLAHWAAFGTHFSDQRKKGF